MRVLKWIGEAVYEAADWVIRPVLKYTRLTIITLAVSLGISYGLWKTWEYNYDKLVSQVEGAQASKSLLIIWSNLAKITDVTDRVPPIMMWANMQSLTTVNAFTTGKGIYVTYVLDAVLNDDEKALVIGHEIAHGILHHTDIAFDMFVTSWSNENELMADNLGAVWAHKAGYDVCKGREVFKKFYDWSGNSLNGSHPPNLMRYENLEHYCTAVSKAD